MQVTEPGDARAKAAALAALREQAHAGPAGTPVPCIIDIRHLGGALSRPPAHPSAVGGRSAQYVLRLMTGGMAAPPEAARPVHQRVYDALKQWTVGRSLNFVHNDGTPVSEPQVRDLFEPETYTRLQSLKSALDPRNSSATPCPRRPDSPGPGSRSPGPGPVRGGVRPPPTWTGGSLEIRTDLQQPTAG
ncbi:hypothetical protein ACU639_12770 [Streptomyces cynarae]|uniref:hypothetical protein n=1 Tax=Streptomyces cynarae TaxID=2981134 RepID=UPI00406CB285